MSVVGQYDLREPSEHGVTGVRGGGVVRSLDDLGQPVETPNVLVVEYSICSRARTPNNFCVRVGESCRVHSTSSLRKERGHDAVRGPVMAPVVHRLVTQVMNRYDLRLTPVGPVHRKGRDRLSSGRGMEMERTTANLLHEKKPEGVWAFGWSGEVIHRSVHRSHTRQACQFR